MDQQNTNPVHLANRRLVRRIVSVFRPYWRTVTFVGLLILVTASLGEVNPILIRVVFDSVLFPSTGGPDLDLLWILFGVMAGITVVVGALGVVQTYFTNRIGQRVMRDLRDRLFRHLEDQPLSFFTGTRTGEIQSRVSNDVGFLRWEDCMQYCTKSIGGGRVESRCEDGIVLADGTIVPIRVEAMPA